MKPVTFAAVAAFAALLPVSSFAATIHHKAKTAVKTAVLICPVTGAKIDSIKDAAGHSFYHGKTYYFCCAGCKPLFDKDPAKYIKTAPAH
ncbi:MAG: YHS domain-containing protein [Capsulimonadaceae bacterium]